MQERTFICYSCGKTMEHVIGQPPCEELVGWFMLSHLKGRESVEHYSFCSVDCLHQWSECQIIKVPDVFLESFKED